MIEVIYTSPAQNVVIQHRRIVTPFFWLRLKSKTFTKKADYQAFVFGVAFMANCWEDGHGTLCPYELTFILEEANISHTVTAFPSKEAKL
jgi:hypothetical protein